MKVTSYKVIQAHDIFCFQNDVNMAIADGWQPHGGLLMNTIDGCPYLTQSMVIYESND